MVAVYHSSSAPIAASIDVSIGCEPIQLSISALQTDPDDIKLKVSVFAASASTEGPITMQVDNTIFEGQTLPEAPEQLHLGMLGSGLICTNPPPDQQINMFPSARSTRTALPRTATTLTTSSHARGLVSSLLPHRHPREGP